MIFFANYNKGATREIKVTMEGKMTKAKLARASMAILLAVTLALCGFVFLGNNARAEEAAVDYSGEYYISIVRDVGEVPTPHYLKGEISNSSLATVPSELPNENLDLFVFVIEATENSTYKIYVKGLENETNRYIANTSSTNVSINSAGTEVTIKPGSSSGTVNICAGDRMLGLNNTYFAKWYMASTAYKFDIILTPVGGPCDHADAIVVDKLDPTCGKEGYTGNTVCSKCGFIISEGEAIQAFTHEYANGECIRCEKDDPQGTYYFVGHRTVGNGWYMTFDLGSASTKRYQAIDAGETLPTEIIANPTSNKEFTLVRNDDGTYKIYAENISDTNKYLGWSSGNSGMLVDESAALNVTLTENDDGTVTFSFESGSDTRCLSLNGTTGNDYFAWYRGTEKHNLILIPVVSGFDITGAQVNVGADLKVNYHVSVDSRVMSADDTLAMNFTMNGETVTVTSEYDESGEYVFTIGGIAPHQMGDLIDAELIVIKDGVEKVVDSRIGYSIEQNLINLASKYADSEEAKYQRMLTLIGDMLEYGRAAQIYKNHNTGDLIGEGEAISGSDCMPDEADAKTLVGENTVIAGAGIWFGDVNKIYFTFKPLGDELDVSINGAEYSLADMVDMGDGTYRLYTSPLSATQLDDVFVVVAGGATLTYSANAYSYSMRNNEKMQDLAIALYRYGVSAEAFVSASVSEN